MATEETEVKKYLRKELDRLAQILDMPIAVVQNPANMQSEQGRADCDIIINRVLYIHAEIKAEGKSLSLNQEVFFEQEQYGFLQVCIAGKVGVDEFIDGLPTLMVEVTPSISARLLQTTAITHAKHGQYIQNRTKRQGAAAKRPARQSSQLH